MDQVKLQYVPISYILTQFKTYIDLSIPGFLQISLHEDARILKTIAQGGAGKICLVEILSKNLLNRAQQSTTAVAKILGNFILLICSIYLFTSTHVAVNRTDPRQVQQFYQELSLTYFLSQKYAYFAEIYG